MTRLPVVSYRVVDSALRRLGFVVVRQHGSHVLYRHLDGRTTTVPRHSGRDIARPLLRVILHEIRVTPDDFAELIRDQ